MAQFRKKPVTVEAVQVTGADGQAADGRPFTEMPEWLDAAMKDGTVTVNPISTATHVCWDVTTPEGVVKADPGDWIVCGAEGEIHARKAETFEQTYDPL